MDATTPVLEAALSTTLVLVRAGKTKLSWASFGNPGGQAAYIQMFDAPGITGAGAPTLGTTPPNAVVLVPAGIAGLTVSINPKDLGFVTGLVVACSATPTGAGAPNAANVCTFGVKAGF
jgi:hypothetical protein